ncbi:hypothetical protein [Chryseobacterium sp. ON_d1]|uniref:hypothetical protein n=1 Tax=Chryseobacterium sp. ON_d1 TaxID=2583211 RepID=UPI00115917F6|nr:hypothetical protein [Chryseobacterium sp. ON_d1]
MKAWSQLLLLFIMIISCSGNSGSQNLTWYHNATISDITEDPDKPNEVVRVAIGISAQVFYLSKKSPDYKTLMEKATQSLKKSKAYDIGIENKTNIIKEINEIK